MNAKDAWLATLGQLQIQLHRSTYDTWLRHAELLGYEDGRFVVTVPHAYARDWIERHLLTSMVQTISGILQRECEIQVIVWDPIEEADDGYSAAPLLAFGDEPIRLQALAALNPKYTFDNFVIGQPNHYAVLLAKAIVSNPAGQYSPVFFSGGMGMGKTHLLQAIARSLLERGDAVIYTNAEDFTTELIAAIRSQDNATFREKYRTADAVIIDDVQFVEGKKGTQNEIVSIWDALRNRQKTIVFAGNVLPGAMQKITGDVRSRLQAGPMAALELPDAQMRRDLLAAHGARRGLALPAEVRDLIAAQAHTSARDLEGAVEQLQTYAQLTHQAITVPVARAILRTPNSGSTPHSGMTLQAVIEATARYYRLSVAALSGRQRTKVVALARQLAMYLAREETSASLLQIGEALGGRDHTTVMHGCTRIAKALASDPSLAQDAENIRQMLGSINSVPIKTNEISAS